MSRTSAVHQRLSTLREVARTAPYMHDGSLATLESVVAFYDSGGVASVHLDTQIKPLGLTLDQRRDLVAFLEALTGTMPQTSGTHGSNGFSQNLGRGSRE